MRQLCYFWVLNTIGAKFGLWVAPETSPCSYPRLRPKILSTVFHVLLLTRTRHVQSLVGNWLKTRKHNSCIKAAASKVIQAAIMIKQSTLLFVCTDTLPLIQRTDIPASVWLLSSQLYIWLHLTNSHHYLCEWLLVKWSWWHDQDESSS